MSHRTQKIKTTIATRGDLAPESRDLQHRFMEVDRPPGVDANKQSANIDNTKSESEQPTQTLELGSKWCSDEIEIFFTSKLETPSLIRCDFKFEFRFPKIRVRMANHPGRPPF
jgi:hypothetical protein